MLPQPVAQPQIPRTPDPLGARAAPRNEDKSRRAPRETAPNLEPRHCLSLRCLHHYIWLHLRLLCHYYELRLHPRLHSANAVHELAAIKAQAMTIRFRELEGENGTVDAVLRAMDEYSWVHLACHATPNSFNPAHSSFHLHDGNLTLEAITKPAFKHKGFAFRFCRFAKQLLATINSRTRLSTWQREMPMAGYPSVIATMWSIYDEDAPKVAGEVYAQLLNEGQMNHRQAARALHKAVTGLRDRVGDKAFKRWVPFIHMGN